MICFFEKGGKNNGEAGVEKKSRPCENFATPRKNFATPR
jgi:hypothetical protein